MPTNSRPTTTPASPFRTSPSVIARYFFHDCDRFLRFSASGAAQQKKDGLPAKVFDHSPLMKAIFESGYAWENMVLDKYLKGNVHIAAGEGEVHTRRFSWQETINLLKHSQPGAYLYQPTLRTPNAFYKRYAIDPAVVSFSDNHPDLIAVLPQNRGRRLFRIMDVKRGESLKLTHRVQVLLYALQLAQILVEEDVADADVDLQSGDVWLGGQPVPTEFDLSEFRPHLEAFLREKLTAVLQAKIQDVPWHVYFRCEWCEYFEHCRDEMRIQDDVSRLAHLTPYGKRHLTETVGVRTIAQLDKFLRRKDADEALATCASLTGARPYLQKQVNALQQAQPQLHGAASPGLPKGENIALFLTFQQEPLGQQIYLAGVYVRAKDELRKSVFSQQVLDKIQTSEGKARPWVAIAERPDQAAKVQEQWIRLVHQILLEVDEYNRRHEQWSDQVSLQAYVHNSLEKSLLLSSLMDALQQPKLAERAMRLLFYFQAPELIVADQHPSQEIPYPLVVVLDALGRLLALPVDVSYTLAESLAALGSTFKYHRNDYFHFPLGHGLRAEAVHAAWYRGKSEYLPQIAKQAEMLLYGVSALLQALRNHAASELFAWPPKFSMPSVDKFDDELLSRLAFFTRYESVLRCLEIRDARSECRETQALLGQMLELRAENEAVMQVVGNGVMEVSEGTFPAWLLVRDSVTGRKAQLEYRDYLCRSKPWSGNSHVDRAVVSISVAEQDEFGFAERLTLSYTKPLADSQPKKGERFLLYPRFTDYTTDRLVNFLRQHVPSDGLFLTLLRDAEKASRPLPLPKQVEEIAGQREKDLRLTPSQLQAYRAIRGRRFVPVWGPPGTGKTHFLASVILGLATTHARAGKPFRVFVSAFTHAAIENVLCKIAELQKQLAGTSSVVLGKAKQWQGNQLVPAEVVEERELSHWLAEHEHCVLGATVYACAKQFEELEPFDLVVVDEASQVRVPEAAIPISLVAERGRLILAGDHLQLPPIVAGTYPEVPEGQPVLHRSIFEAVCSPPEAQSDLLKQLSENFRMNDVLTSFAAALLYGPAYRCFDKHVAQRRLQITLPSSADAFTRACLDPGYPLAIVVLEGVQAARENLVEATLVANLVNMLRERLCTAEGKSYKEDAHFFREGVFIVSPHRAQIRTIQQALRGVRSWTHTPFVDTVDKMQGQEADAVIVSYGVADPEFAMQEADFIYGLNRLNVAITRAKTKCVVCLPKPLLDASPNVLEQPEAARGLAYMRQLVSRAADSGESIKIELEGGVAATVYRTAACIE